MRFSATHRYARIAPMKVRYVIDMIRGKSADYAVQLLKCVHKRSAPMIKKILDSAIANADQKGVSNLNDLVIVEAKADVGPMWKRYRPGPMGRAMRIRKRTSHIQIVLEERKQEKQEDKKSETK
jgi:large subunit ribosomal protein L22